MYKKQKTLKGLLLAFKGFASVAATIDHKRMSAYYR